MTIFFQPKFIILTCLLFCCLAVSPLSLGQQSSEQFIPIGQSPGISGKLSYIGTITKIDRAENTLVLESDQGTKTVTITSTTRFWIDRSKVKQPNLMANFGNSEVGQLVEVKHDGKNKNIADWIKIESM